MSKAFTKEDSDAESSDEELESPDLPQGLKNYITAAGAKRLQEELRTLLHVERPKVVSTVAWAASNGDRSENGDYIYGKRRLREIDRRVRFLTKRLERAEIVDLSSQKNDEIRFGATVTIEDEDGKRSRYRIVGIDESDPKRGDISWISPLAKLLLGARVGDAVTFRNPRGVEEELTVVRIEVLNESQ